MPDYSASYRQHVTVDCIASDHVAAWARCCAFLNRRGADPTAVFPIGPGEMVGERPR